MALYATQDARAAFDGVYHLSPLCNLTLASFDGLVYGDGKMLPPPF